MTEKPKWTATEFRCDIGYVAWIAEFQDWQAYKFPPRHKSSRGPTMLGHFHTAEEAQSAVENAR